MRKTALLLVLAGVSTSAFAIMPDVSGAPFANIVGQVNNASGVVIAPNWVLTAKHVGSGTFNLNGTNYTPAQSFIANGTLGAPSTDLVLMRFNETFTEYATPFFGPTTGQLATIVGFGGTGAPNGVGYAFTGGQGVLRQGNNFISVSSDAQTLFGENFLGDNISLLAFDIDGVIGGNVIDTFGDGGPNSLESQYAGGDSGGGMFLLINGQWRIVGINSGIFDAFDPGGGLNSNFNFGDGGFATNLTPYSGWIEGHIGVVPEPATMAVFGLGIAALAARRRKRSS